ncbi:tRNA N6-adenosine threonylcarbamoyltransferase [Candidatus Desulfarcum epimagneticum]|uniref:tRNA N6-adenosine threonylcarbamoyltransferase n=1 Tax=uncultured Desulfobacteraceae bacterium TaxID=218296 RepID=A0A484HK95_9BACT|nr:tRNA N6-adenosine threonylcarbamoyltransferase [uncultured Desulfobacteraceae bacterium]
MDGLKRTGKEMKDMIILGIETSCDETAAALVSDGTKILSSTVFSQIRAHRPFGGVVPEIASRKHIEALVPALDDAFEKAGLGFDDIDAIAVTMGPGLIGSLLAGFSFAKACAFSRGLPWIGVNHLEGHVNSVFLEPAPPPFPFVALLASGGHTTLYHATSHTRMEIMGQTRDDAAGEAYDKVSGMLGLGYPGGKVIDDLAAAGEPGNLSFPRAWLDKNAFDFSFSGLKTAVKRHIEAAGALSEKEIRDIAAEFQAAAVDVLACKLIRAAEKKDCRHIAVVGGVAANQGLGARVRKDADAAGMTVHIPSPGLCGDNAAMIASAGHWRLMEKGPENISPGLGADVFSKIPPLL